MPASSVPLIDSDRLNQRTMGNESFKVEILALFMAEAERLLAQVEAAAEPGLRADRLRAMSALASGVGAARLAQAARTAERATAGDGRDLGSLRAALAETMAWLQSRAV